MKTLEIKLGQTYSPETLEKIGAEKISAFHRLVTLNSLFAVFEYENKVYKCVQVDEINNDKN